jgi:hypothetical protein
MPAQPQGLPAPARRPPASPARQPEVRRILHGPRDPVLQRRIVVNEKPYTPGRRFLKQVQDDYGDAMVELVARMHNGGEPPDHAFDSREQLRTEIRLRHSAIQSMADVNVDPGCCSYPTSTYDSGYLDPTYWEKQGPLRFTVKSPLPAGKEASDAIEAIFAKGAGTELECNSMLVAIQYRSMLKALGEEAFNEKFPKGQWIFISPHHRAPRGQVQHPLREMNLYEQVSIASSADLLPGDLVYFKNVPDYLERHPDGAWAGEHGLYLGGGMFRGFGIDEVDEEGLKKELLAEYNKGLPAEAQKTLDDVPGLPDYVRRPVIEEITRWVK